MKHLLNICNINGAEVESVDVIIGGSPCQDLSVAGKRAGFDGERSVLFLEQTRIIKEMRNATNGTCPRYMVWENVPGAFSSDKGEVFRIVLEETAKIADEAAVIPRPDKGKWTNSGAVMGDGWSIAWRVFDAQFWGVPQRRRRIALVADFGGQSAPEILFERNGVSGDTAESGAQGEGVAGSVESGADKTECLTSWDCQSKRIFDVEGCYPTLQAMGDGGANNTAIFLQGNGIDRADTAGCNGKGWREDVCYTLNTIDRPAVFDARGNGDGSIATYSFQRTDELKESRASSTQSARQYKSPTDLVVAVDCRNLNETGETFGTLQAKPNGGQSLNYSGAVRQERSVRRLTPLECERLQGYPDNWTNIPPQTEVTAEDLSFWRTVWNEWQEMNGAKPKTDKQIIKWLKSEAVDSARYKALGNSIALPPWRFVLSRIHKQGARTMASLFDGIGGFPKIWQELGGQTLWCSEVEPFPIAVTRYHFKETR